jgi:hypothetical protein
MMSAQLQLDNRCHHTSADGRRCRMLRAEDDPSLCPDHRRQQFPPHMAPEAIAAELLRSIENLQTATAVNLVLGRLFALVASQRIAPRQALILAYIGQLLLNSVPVVGKEMTFAEGLSGWCDILHDAVNELRHRNSVGLAEMLLKPGRHARDNNDGKSNP